MGGAGPTHFLREKPWGRGCGQGQLVLPNLCRGKRSFKQYQNKFDSVKEVGEKDKELCNVDPKICMKILFHYLPALLI